MIANATLLVIVWPSTMTKPIPHCRNSDITQLFTVTRIRTLDVADRYFFLYVNMHVQLFPRKTVYEKAIARPYVEIRFTL